MQALLQEYKMTDWADTPIYASFLKNGRWVHDNDEIFSEIEVKYLLTTLGKMFENTNHKEEFKKTEGAMIIKQHSKKTFKTLESLMTHLNMNYFWLRISLFFSNRSPELEELSKLLNRCLKLYACITEMMNIFKLIQRFKVS